MRVLILSQVQCDFFESLGGRCCIRGSEKVLEPIKALKQRHFDLIVYTQTYHHPSGIGFSSNLPGSRVGEDLHLPLHGPVHITAQGLIVGTPGAQLHPELGVTASDIVILSCIDPSRTSGSALGDIHTGKFTFLHNLLVENDVTEVYLAGMPLETSIVESALDIRASLPRVPVFVVSDACAATSQSLASEVYSKLQLENIQIIVSSGPELNRIPPAHPAPTLRDMLIAEALAPNQAALDRLREFIVAGQVEVSISLTSVAQHGTFFGGDMDVQSPQRQAKLDDDEVEQFQPLTSPDRGFASDDSNEMSCFAQCRLPGNVFLRLLIRLRRLPGARTFSFSDHGDSAGKTLEKAPRDLKQVKLPSTRRSSAVGNLARGSIKPSSGSKKEAKEDATPKRRNSDRADSRPPLPPIVTSSPNEVYSTLILLELEHLQQGLLGPCLEHHGPQALADFTNSSMKPKTLGSPTLDSPGFSSSIVKQMDSVFASRPGSRRRSIAGGDTVAGGIMARIPTAMTTAFSSPTALRTPQRVTLWRLADAVAPA